MSKIKKEEEKVIKEKTKRKWIECVVCKGTGVTGRYEEECLECRGNGGFYEDEE